MKQADQTGPTTPRSAGRRRPAVPHSIEDLISWRRRSAAGRLGASAASVAIACMAIVVYGIASVFDPSRLPAAAGHLPCGAGLDRRFGPDNPEALATA